MSRPCQIAGSLIEEPISPEGSGAINFGGAESGLGEGLIYAARTAFQIAGAAWSVRRKDPRANWPL